MATATFTGTYTANGGEDYASGTVTLTPYGGSPVVVTLDAAGHYVSSPTLVLTSVTGLWITPAGAIVTSQPASGSQLIAPGGTITRTKVKVDEAITGAPPRSYLVEVVAGQTVNTGRDVGVVLGRDAVSDHAHPGVYAEAAATTAALAAKANDNAVLHTTGAETAGASRSVADAVLNGTTTVTSATIAFTDADIGSLVIGAGIPFGTTIVSRNSATSAVMSAVGTAGTNVSIVLRSGMKTLLGGVTFRGPRSINLRSFGVSPGGVINTALPAALREAAVTGAELVIDPTPNTEYLWTLTTPIILPKTFGFRMTGVEQYGSQIVATQVTAGQPMVKWDDTVAGHVEAQSVANLFLRRSGTDGPVIQFLQSTPTPGSAADLDHRLGDRWKGTIENVRVQNITGGTYPVIHIAYILHGRILFPFIYGSSGAGGIGVLLEDGSDGRIEDYKTPLKSNAPRTGVKLVNGGGHHVLGTRTEGTGWGGAGVHLDNCINNLIELSTEGTGEDAVVYLVNSHANVILQALLGYPDQSGSGKPRAMKFVGSCGNKVLNGLVGDWSTLKDDVRLATVAALPANTRSTNVLTASANGALPNIDGVAPALTNRILVKNEATGANNGIYTVTDLGSGGTPWILTRATDADTTAEVTYAMSMLVQEGSTLAHTRWNLSTSSVTLNTTALVFAQVGGVVSPFTAGDGTGGKIIEFDATSNENEVQLTVNAGLNPKAQVLNNGRANKVRLTVQSTNNPTHQVQTIGYPVQQRKKPTRWYVDPGTPSTALMVVNRLYFRKLDIDEYGGIGIDRLGVGITTGATAASGALIRVGLYADDGANWPGALMFDSGTLGGVGVGMINAETIAAASIVMTKIPLETGRYWKCCVWQGAAATGPTVRNGGSISDDTIGFFTHSDAYAAALYQDSVSGSLPSTAAPTAVITPAPLIAVRIG